MHEVGCRNTLVHRRLRSPVAILRRRLGSRTRPWGSCTRRVGSFRRPEASFRTALASFDRPSASFPTPSASFLTAPASFPRLFGGFPTLSGSFLTPYGSFLIVAGNGEPAGAESGPAASTAPFRDGILHGGDRRILFGRRMSTSRRIVRPARMEHLTELVEFTAQCVREAGADTATLRDIRLAVSEVCSTTPSCHPRMPRAIGNAVNRATWVGTWCTA